jgi:hypothetical protein
MQSAMIWPERREPSPRSNKEFSLSEPLAVYARDWTSSEPREGRLLAATKSEILLVEDYAARFLRGAFALFGFAGISAASSRAPSSAPKIDLCAASQ